MTSPSIPREPVVAALTAEWGQLDDLLAGLPDAAWATATELPGWSVSDVVAHVIGTEAMLAGEQPPATDVDVKALPHVRNDIAAVNELWVESLRGRTPAQVLERFREVTGRRAAALEAMTQEDFDAPSWTPAGQATYGRFMQIRVFDCWMHEQDIRAAIGRPGNQACGAADTSLGEVARSVGYLVGKRAGAPDGSRVKIQLTGPIQRTFLVAVDGRAAVVPELPGPPDATIRLSSSLFLRLVGGRTAAAEHLPEIELEGDLDLARRVVDNLAYTI